MMLIWGLSSGRMKQQQWQKKTKKSYKTIKHQNKNGEVQSNLWITTTEGTGNKWSYFQGGLICQAWF